MRKLELKLNDIPEQHREFASLIGLEKFINVCEFYGGSTIYIPTVKTLKNNVLKEDILYMHFELEMTIAQIARKCKLSGNHIRYIIKKSSTVAE